MMEPTKSITVVISPYHVGACDNGVATGPHALIRGGLIDQLQEQGLKVHQVELPPVDDFEGEIGKTFELLRRTSKAVTEALSNNSFPIILAGNCCSTVGVSAGICAFSQFEAGDETPGCVWFDAHDDYNTPDALASGYFDSMGIAMLAGQCWNTLLRSIPGFRPIDLQKVIHCGMRDVSDLERSRVEQAGFDVIWGNTETAVDFESELRASLENRKLRRTMVHVDLDSLDVSVGQVNKFSAPGGLQEQDLVGCLRLIASQAQPVSLTIASFDPTFDKAGKIPSVAIRSVLAFMDEMILQGRIG